MKTKLIWEGRWSISVENYWKKSPLEIRNEEKVGLTKEFCSEDETLADVKQVESFINNITAYREAMHHSVKARQITGLKTSNSLSIHPGGVGSFIDLRFLCNFVTLIVALLRCNRQKSDLLGDVS